MSTANIRLRHEALTLAQGLETIALEMAKTAKSRDDFVSINGNAHREAAKILNERAKNLRALVAEDM